MSETLVAKAITINQDIQNFIQQKESLLTQQASENSWFGERFLADLFDIDMGANPALSTLLWFNSILFILTLIILILIISDKFKKKESVFIKKLKQPKILFFIFALSLAIQPVYLMVKIPTDLLANIEITKEIRGYAKSKLQNLLDSKEITPDEHKLFLSCYEGKEININCILKQNNK